jgi:hypothetical protein
MLPKVAYGARGGSMAGTHLPVSSYPSSPSQGLRGTASEANLVARLGVLGLWPGPFLSKPISSSEKKT